MSPDEDAKQADGQRGRDHQAIGEDATAREVGDDHRRETHAGKYGDVDLRVAEEPEEMEPEERRAGALAREEPGVDDVRARDEEGAAEMTIAEEKQDGREKH